MKYEYLKNTPVDEAKEMYLSFVKQKGCQYKTECVQTRDALHRVTASAVYAKRCSPHYCASAMDGIAVLSSKTIGATEKNPIRLQPDDFVIVDTGDALPANADAVIMVENLLQNDDGSVLIHSAAVPWQNVRQIGEDVSMGDMLAPSFTQVSSSMIGAFLAGGVSNFKAVKKPVCALIPTGDEIVCADDELTEGDIPEFNTAVFAAMLKEWGAESVVFPIVPDSIDKLTEVVQDAASKTDFIIVIAGSSAGRDDYTSTVLKNCGDLLLHGVAMKPGKPAVLGAIGSIPFLGVPGYPVSGIMVMREFAKPIIEYLNCCDLPDEQNCSATLTKKLTSALKYEEFIRCRVADMNGKTVAVPMDRGAGIVSGYAKCSALLQVPQNCEGYEAGDAVGLHLLTDEKVLENTLMIVGSHDPLLDEMWELLRQTDRRYHVSSAHVGSMGGIMAVKRGEAHLGGIHLLDETTGIYNFSYVRKFFPDGGVKLIRGVGRLQGLMLPKDNPKQIHSFADISTKNCSYVNRQKGSGTRILLDYLLRKDGIDSEKLYGYTREEFTHTAVAAIVKAGSADAGLGIYSAAKIYDLDFVPLWNERYDLLIAESAIADPVVQEFLNVLRSDDLKDRLLYMGGYTVEGIGEEIDWR